MSDYIDSLATDNDPVSQSEKVLINSIFKSDEPAIQKFILELKLPIIIGIFFMIISSPQVTNFIKHTVPYARSSDVSLLCFKTILFIILVFVYNNCNIVMST